MFSTKYLIVGTLSAFVTMIAGSLLFAIQDVPMSAQFAAVGSSRAPAVSEEGVTPQVTVDSREKDLSVRDRLREKLAHFTRATVPATPEEDVATVSDAADVEESAEGENGIIEGGRIVGIDRQGSAPQIGAVYTCTPSFPRGTTHDTPWVKEGVWYPDLKPVVPGAKPSVGSVSITVVDGVRSVVSDGLPNHSVGNFTDSALLSHALTVSLPTMPTVNAVPYCVPRGVVGIARNGVPIYAAQNEYGEDAVAYEVLDACGGRPGESGLYHYYGESICLFDRVYEGAPSTMLGYALDGFGIFAKHESGKDVQNSDLDVCHGHEHIIPWDGEMVSMYHYHMTDEFPYSVGCFMGEPTSLSTN